MITRLDALNEILEFIGEQGVNSLAFEQSDGSEYFEAKMALRTLDREKQRSLATGYWFNTDDNYMLPRDNTHSVRLMDSILQVEEADNQSQQYVRRNGKLFNRSTNSYTFTANPLCKVIWDLELDQCPIVFAEYVILKTARKMVDKTLGGVQLHGYTQQDEDRAYLSLQMAENNQVDANIFDSPDMQDNLDRRSDTFQSWLY